MAQTSMYTEREQRVRSGYGWEQRECHDQRSFFGRVRSRLEVSNHAINGIPEFGKGKMSKRDLQDVVAGAIWIVKDVFLIKSIPQVIHIVRQKHETKEQKEAHVCNKKQNSEQDLDTV